MAPAGHTGPVVDRVGDLVREVGPVVGLYRLEEAEGCALRLAAEARERGQHHSAAGFQRAALSLQAQQFDLVARFA